MLEKARERAARKGIRNVRLLQMDAADLKFADDSFDIVYAPYLISVVPDPVKVAQEMRRVCRPGRPDHLPEPLPQLEPAPLAHRAADFAVHDSHRLQGRSRSPGVSRAVGRRADLDREGQHAADLVARDVREGLTRPLWLAVIVAAFALPLFVGLGVRDLENDEAIYSYAVDSVLARGDWLNPVLSPFESTRFLEKPPLKFWIVGAPIALGLLPHNEVGFRVWDARLRLGRFPLRVCPRPQTGRTCLRAGRGFHAVCLPPAPVRARAARQRHGRSALPQLLRRRLSLPRLGVRRAAEARDGACYRRDAVLRSRLHDQVRRQRLPADDPDGCDA